MLAGTDDNPRRMILGQNKAFLEIGDTPLVRRVTEAAVRSVEGVLPDRPVDAHFHDFGDSARLMRVRWWIDDMHAEKRIIELAKSIIYSISKIASGAISAAAAFIDDGAPLPSPQLAEARLAAAHDGGCHQRDRVRDPVRFGEQLRRQADAVLSALDRLVGKADSSIDSIWCV